MATRLAIFRVESDQGTSLFLEYYYRRVSDTTIFKQVQDSFLSLAKVRLASIKSSQVKANILPLRLYLWWPPLIFSFPYATTFYFFCSQPYFPLQINNTLLFTSSYYFFPCTHQDLWQRLHDGHVLFIFLERNGNTGTWSWHPADHTMQKRSDILPL